MAHNFQKISAPFGRATPKDKLVDRNIYTADWVKLFNEYNVKMYASEKIDGTSVGIKWDGERISFIGHTDKSQFSPRYLEYLNNRFNTPEFESVIEEVFGDKPATVYGEGISKDYNVHYGFPDGNFIMYDVQGENGKYFNRAAVKDIAVKLDITYPYEEIMTISDSIDFIKARPRSRFNSDFMMEGLVLRPLVELYTNNDSRVICKVKVRDFVDLKDYKQGA